MRIKSIKLKQFRRFEDLTIDGLPETARLIIILGPNGFGKSSLFDGFIAWSRQLGGWGFSFDPDYHQRRDDAGNNAAPECSVDLYGTVPLDQPGRRKLFYVRTAHRNDPDFGQQVIQRPESAVDEVRFSRTIDNDATVKRNYDRYVYRTIDEVHDVDSKADRSQSVKAYADSFIRRISDPLGRVLPGLRVESLGKPGTGSATFYFRKTGRRYHYKNLSGGEKAVFDLLLDMVVKTEEFDDTVFCIDEPEAHLNPAVHGQCLEELLALVPRRSQLCVATHSIGMLRRARDLSQRYPGEVVFLDFEQDFEKPVHLTPVAVGREVWDRVLRTALDDLAALVAPERIMVCEGGTVTGNGDLHEDGIDAEVYSKVFANEMAGTRFYSAGSHKATATARNALLGLSRSVLSGVRIERLIDRDDRSDEEVKRLHEDGARVLDQRHLESYLFSDEILTRMCESVGQIEKATEILAKKQELLKAARYTDDVKSISGSLYVFTKRTLRLAQSGNDQRTFMRDTLAPLITQDTETYRRLREVLGD